MCSEKFNVNSQYEFQDIVQCCYSVRQIHYQIYQSLYTLTIGLTVTYQLT